MQPAPQIIQPLTYISPGITCQFRSDAFAWKRGSLFSIKDAHRVWFIFRLSV